MKQYDYLIVGAGLFGSVFAQQMTKKGKKCLVIERRDHIAGNVYTEKEEGIQVHKYGAHIFHTSNKEVWDYVNSFVEFNRYTNSPIANYKGKLYNLPFNMNTFYQLWGVKTPEEAQKKIEEQKAEFSYIKEPCVCSFLLLGYGDNLIIHPCHSDGIMEGKLLRGILYK